MHISHAAETIEIAGVPIAVRVWGAGATVLCLHATGHDSEDFAPFARQVSDGFRVVALDWPGQGVSPSDEVGPNARRYAEIAVCAIDTLGLKRPVLLGNSIGGAAAIFAAAQAPDRVRALILCNAGGLAPVDGLARFVTARMAAFFEAGAAGASWFPAAFETYYRWFVLPRAPERRAVIVARARAQAPLLASAWRGFSAPDADLREEAKSLTLPVWAAWARDDRFVSWGRARAAVKSIRGARVTLYRGGHAAFLEDLNRFEKGFRIFMRRIEKETS